MEFLNGFMNYFAKMCYLQRIFHGDETVLQNNKFSHNFYPRHNKWFKINPEVLKMGLCPGYFLIIILRF
jgi:hypothetical protein